MVSNDHERALLEDLERQMEENPSRFGEAGVIADLPPYGEAMAPTKEVLLGPGYDFMMEKIIEQAHRTQMEQNNPHVQRTRTTTMLEPELSQIWYLSLFNSENRIVQSTLIWD